MSRRQSRVSLVDRQNEALQEFETLKRKYLQYNKQIIKDNSNLRVQVEELKVQLSTIYAENLALGKANIGLEKELKKEKAMNKRRGQTDALQKADSIAAAMIKQLETLRGEFTMMNAPPTPSPLRPPKEPISRARPSLTHRLAIISKAPDFELIQEADSEDEIEPSLRPDPEFIPLPDDDDIPQRSTTPPSPPPNAVASSSTNVTARRKPSRRQSGLLGPAKTRAMSPTDEPTVDEELEVNALLSDSLPSTLPTKQPFAPRIPLNDGAPKPKKKGKERDPEARGLKDVTNSPPPKERASSKGIMSVLTEHSGSGDERMTLPELPKQGMVKKEKMIKSKYNPPALVEDPLIDPTPMILDDPPVFAGAEQDAEGSAAIRPSRARKSVNYAEPKLNTKMRKPDDALPGSLGFPTLPISAHPNTQPVSSSNTTLATSPPDRPIKPLVLPSSLKREQKRPTKPAAERVRSTDEPCPPSNGASTSRATSKTVPRRPASPSRQTMVPLSDEESVSQASEEESGNSASEAGDDSDSPRRSPRRSTNKVVSEIKSASLSAGPSLGKPARLESATRPIITAPTPRLESSSIYTFPRKPVASTSATGRLGPVTPSSAAPSSAANTSRKRKAAPSKYDYFDISSDEDNAPMTSKERDSEHQEPPKDRRKTMNTTVSSSMKGRSDSGKDRRLSSAT